MTGIATETTETTSRTDTLVDWARINGRLLASAAGVVVLAGIGYWFYTTQQVKKNQNADRSLLTATQSLATGNQPLAESDLQKIVTRYDDTRAGVEAAMLLAQLNYQKGAYQKGIDVLQKVDKSAGASGSTSAIRGLIADGQAQMGKLKEAAKSYRDAAEAAQMAGERDYLLSKAARTLAASGDAASARELWQRIADDPDANEGLVAEARVRLGELSARPAGKS